MRFATRLRDSLKSIPWVVLAVVSLGIFLGMRSPAPSPVRADIASELFSSGRAMVHLREIAREPHPTGTDANAKVRRYLVNALDDLGMDVLLQRDTVSDPYFRRQGITELTNVIARRPGTASTGGLALVAHYDSSLVFQEDPTRLSSGAGDDGAGVAAILETLRALSASTPLRNDLYVVLTDAEELNLLGARAFTDHPWFSEISLVLNFEGRGNSGPSLMFETTLPNEWMIDTFHSAAEAPVGASLMANIYRKMPNNTDFTIFRLRGVPGLNFAFIGGYDAYHTPKDTYENFDESSLQHHGTTMLGLARAFGNHDFQSPPPEGSSVYFNPLGSFFVSYPEDWIWPLNAIVTLLGVLVFYGGFRKQKFRSDGVALTFVVCLGSLMVLTAIIFATSHGVLQLKGSYRLFPWGFTSNDTPFFLGQIALAAAGWTWVLRRLEKRHPGCVEGGTAVLWWLALLASSVGLPGGTFLFLWPLAIFLVVVGLTHRLDLTEKRCAIVHLSCLTLVVPMLVAILVLFFQGMMLGLSAVPILLVLMVLGLLWPTLRPWRGPLPFVFFGLALTTFTYGIVFVE